MSNKISPCRQELQTNFRKSFAKSRRRKCHGGLTAPVASTFKRVRRAIRASAGVCAWDVASLAAYCDISERQFTRDMKVLDALGWVIRIERKTADGRNETNLLMLPDLVPSRMGDKNGGEKQELLKTKTTTPARENPRIEEISPAKPEPTTSRQEWEARRAQDREDHHRMRERYDAVGRTIVEEIEQRRAASEENRRWWREGERHRWDGGKEHRLARAEERTRRASDAMVGVYTGPIVRMSDEDRENYKAEMAILDARRAERLKNQHGGMMEVRA